MFIKLALSALWQAPFMVSRRGLSFRWRIALFSSIAIALLSVLASAAAFAVVRSSLVGDLRRSLEQDVARVAAEYNAEYNVAPNGTDGGSAQAGGLEASDLQSVATGGVIIQLYNASGERFAASNDTEDSETFVIPAGVVVSALNQPQAWRGELGGQSVQAALAPASLIGGVVAVLSPTDYISAALTQLARTLALVAAALIVVSVALGYLVAAAAAYPVTQLAAAAAQLDPSDLRPIAYNGPDDEVGRLSAVLNDLVVRLKTSVEAQRTFLAETSHELRTPLTSLQGFLDRSVRRSPPSLRGELEDAQRIARSMSRLVADLLQLTRGQLVLEYTPHLLDPASDILRPIAEEFPGVRLEAQAGDLLLGDPERLKQLIRNLTANAVRATGNPRKVTLGLLTEEGEAVLLVRDRGPGISDDMLPHLFEKFHKGVGGGAGLGLAIAKQIADAHSGRIEVESFKGRGTTFRVFLPALQDELVEEEA